MSGKNLEMEHILRIHGGGLTIEKTSIYQVGGMDRTFINQLMGLEAINFSHQLQEQLVKEVFDRMVSD